MFVIIPGNTDELSDGGGDGGGVGGRRVDRVEKSSFSLECPFFPPFHSTQNRFAFSATETKKKTKLKQQVCLHSLMMSLSLTVRSHRLWICSGFHDFPLTSQLMFSSVLWCWLGSHGANASWSPRPTSEVVQLVLRQLVKVPFKLSVQTRVTFFLHQ